MDNFTPLKLGKKEKVNKFLIIGNFILVVIIGVIGIFFYNKTLITTEEKAAGIVVFPSQMPTNVPTLVPTDIPVPTSSSSPTLTVSPIPIVTQKLIVIPTSNQMPTGTPSKIPTTSTEQK